MTGAGNAPTYAQIMDADGVLHPAKFGSGPGTATISCGSLETTSRAWTSISLGLYSQWGKWHRGGEATRTPRPKSSSLSASTRTTINYLGAELELGMGKDYERHVFNKPTVAICPQDFRTCRSSTPVG